MTEVQSRRHSSSDADEVVEYLQLTGKRYREHVELLRQEHEAREAQRAPFKPTISAYAERASKAWVMRQESSIGQRLHELHQKKLALLAEEAAESAKRRETEEQNACTFAPAVTAKAERSARRGGDVSVLLSRWEEQRRARQVRRQMEATRNELSAATGVPCISAYAKEKAQAEHHRRAVPMEESLLAEAEARRQRQHAAFEQRYAATSAPSMPNRGSGTDSRLSSRRFVPAISSYAANVQFQQGVVDRLYTHHRTQQQQQHQGRDSGGRCVYDEEMALHCTFRPQLSPQSVELSKLYYAEEGEVGAKPHDRLYRNTHHTSTYRKSVLPDESAFGKPEINDASRRIIEERRRQLALEGNPGALGHSPCSRLYPGRAKSAPSTSPPRATFKKKVMTAKDMELQTALTFAPCVSAASDALWRQRVTALKSTGVARNVDEARQLLWRKAEKKKADDIAKMLVQRRREEAAACTFRPKAGRPPHRRSGYISMPIEVRTTLWAKQREARLSELREELEASAVEECSFRPHVDPVFPLPRLDAKLATGVEMFVERQAEARRLREEAKEWWRPKYACKLALEPSATSKRRLQPRAEAATTSTAATPRSAASVDRSLEKSGSAADRTDSSLQRAAMRTSADRSCEDEDEAFVQHWARRPPSTSLTASSFSHASQPEVPSAESSPRQLADVAHQPAAMSVRRERNPPADPYRWRGVSAHETSTRSTTAPPVWRKPLRYRPR
ncbi:hypothetical protein ABL78_7145 [Leptomonas seymouri]|uniref:Uncharacterized protein n=1 Tax=Leptomonas seymouri TaxID=5684 RepID=A0A0N1IHI3_LEPSE|nr:hypothetical protein ABL78_7145 [Leptomonas seymouri]|eukprot:KPI83811.1 hypothetical protein ABL78_7145 [Leptomonas seymouri]